MNRQCKGKTYWVSRRVEKVRTSISSNGVMTSAMNAKISIREIALHAVLESENIVAVLEELSDNLIPRQIRRILVNISVYAPGIISQPISLRVRFDTRYFRGDGSESHSPVRQGSGNAASAASGVELDGTVW